MPVKNNHSQALAAPQEKRQCNPYWMIRNAESLQRAVKHLDEPSLDSLEGDPDLFSGRVLAAPILLTLAIELALKAWLYQEQRKDPPRGHDLLELFHQLKPGTQEALQAQMPGWTDLWFARESPYPHGSLLEILWQERKAHTHWRYIHEKPSASCQTGLLHQALTVIISTYHKRWLSAAV